MDSRQHRLHSTYQVPLADGVLSEVMAHTESARRSYGLALRAGAQQHDRLDHSREHHENSKATRRAPQKSQGTPRAQSCAKDHFPEAVAKDKLKILTFATFTRRGMD
eukprot:Skav229677  [mRNA]  locus=scaffold4264:105212:105923:+ [translate_table: standard]